MFRPHVGGIFDSRHFPDGQFTACHRLLHPKTWVWRCLTRATPRLEAIAFDAVASTLHVVSPPLTSQEPWPLRRELSMHSWSTRKTQLRLSLSPPHSELLPTRQGYAHQASRTKAKSTVGSSHTLPSRCLTSGCSACLLCTTKHPGLPFRNRTRRFRACMFLVLRLLHLSRKFLHCELQLTSVLTEIAGPHRPRSVASSTLCIKLLAIVFISRPHTRSTVTPGCPRVERRPRAPIARLPLRLEDTVSTVCSGGLLLAHRP